METGRLQQGVLLDTKQTRTWGPTALAEGRERERRSIFRNFTPMDDGRSRKRVAECQDPEDARRLVACWNACEGISTERLEGMATLGMPQVLRESYKEADALRAQLVAAMEGEQDARAECAALRDERAELRKFLQNMDGWLANTGHSAEHPWRKSIAIMLAPKVAP